MGPWSDNDLTQMDVSLDLTATPVANLHWFSLRSGQRSAGSRTVPEG